MKTGSHVLLTPRMQEAIDELKGLITAHFPQATFVVEEGFDPEGVYLVTTVDIADTDEVIAVVGDRLVDLQVDESLPVYVTMLRPRSWRNSGNALHSLDHDRKPRPLDGEECHPR
ncbi:MAG TPA: hypothetical protein VFC02_17470 [Anaerolineales bacterium]|nr:hypothetical protein [Anaerolineales bacterium]